MARRLLIAGAAAVVALLVWINVEMLTEAYGAGPPHFGRTTNMDKWTNPVPGLLVLDAVGLAAAALLLRLGLRRPRG